MKNMLYYNRFFYCWVNVNKNVYKCTIKPQISWDVFIQIEIEIWDDPTKQKKKNNKKKRSMLNKKKERAKWKKETRIFFYQKQFVVQMIYTSYYKILLYIYCFTTGTIYMNSRDVFHMHWSITTRHCCVQWNDQ